MDSTCRLCGTIATLQLSHIIPEFLYRPLYDDKHRYVVITKDLPKHRFEQQGLRELLLCRTCEHDLSRLETYAAEIMAGRSKVSAHRIGSRIVMRNIDYAKFKLFQMSILWRASVSSLRFFTLVELGPLQERLREMLLHAQPGGVDQFGCAIVFATDRGMSVRHTIFNPEPLRWSGRRMIKFFFASSAWVFYCDTRPAPPYLHRLFLHEDGSLHGLIGDLAEARALRAQR